MGPSFTAQHLGKLEDGTSLARFAVEVGEVEQREDGSMRARLHVLPAGPLLNTNDGRRYVMADGYQVVANSELPALVDVDHAADVSHDTKATAWVERLEFDPESGIYADALFTTEWGFNSVKSREYRFTSAVVAHDDDGVIHAVRRVSLTNMPAMPVEQISAFSKAIGVQRAASAQPPNEGNGMDEAQVKKALLSQLGLPEDVTKAAEQVAQFAELGAQVKELTTQVATLSEQHKQALKRAEDAEKKIEEERAAAKLAAFSAEVDRFLGDECKPGGRVIPAEREELRELATVSEAQFATVKAMVEKRKPIGGPAPASKPKAEGVAQFSEAVIEGLHKRGLTDEQIERAAKVAPGRRPSEEE